MEIRQRELLRWLPTDRLKAHQIRSFSTLSGRHEQVVCIAKRDEGDIDRDVGVRCLERLDRLRKTFSSLLSAANVCQTVSVMGPSASMAVDASSPAFPSNRTERRRTRAGRGSRPAGLPMPMTTGHMSGDGTVIKPLWVLSLSAGETHERKDGSQVFFNHDGDTRCRKGIRRTLAAWIETNESLPSTCMERSISESPTDTHPDASRPFMAKAC